MDFEQTKEQLLSAIVDSIFDKKIAAD